MAGASVHADLTRTSAGAPPPVLHSPGVSANVVITRRVRLLTLDQSAAPDPRACQKHTHTTSNFQEGTLATATQVKIRPLEDRVLVTIDDEEQTTASGLVIPDTAKEKPQQGTVIAVGPGKRSETTGDLIQVDVNEGDTVLFSKYGGTEVKVGGEEYLILSARDILAVINE
ncbi:MAG: co-chaperone GroES [Actinobacteria bacterium]|nr:co-chaperone GroES [Actinomycetota bacterium]